MQSLAFSSTIIAGARVGTCRGRAAVSRPLSQTRGASVSPAAGAFPVSLGRRVRAAAAADAAADSAAALDALLGIVPEPVEGSPEERAAAADGRACQILPVPAPSSNAIFTFVP